jgi:hypothetical protein
MQRRFLGGFWAVVVSACGGANAGTPQVSAAPAPVAARADSRQIAGPIPNATETTPSQTSPTTQQTALPATSAPPAAPPPSQAAASPAERAACRRTCESSFQATTSDIAERLSAQIEGCPATGDNDQAECLQIAQNEIAQATTNAKAIRQACLASCVDTGRPL